MSGESEAVLAAYHEQLKTLFMYASTGSKQPNPEGFFADGLARLRSIRDFALTEIAKPPPEVTGFYYVPMVLRRVA
jgi:hypothetical protein